MSQLFSTQSLDSFYSPTEAISTICTITIITAIKFCSITYGPYNGNACSVPQTSHKHSNADELIQASMARKKGIRSPLPVYKMTYSTGYSQAVTHPSTNPAQCCLPSVISREPVHSAWYGRRTDTKHTHGYLLYKNNVKMV